MLTKIVIDNDAIVPSSKKHTQFKILRLAYPLGPVNIREYPSLGPWWWYIHSNVLTGIPKGTFFNGEDTCQIQCLFSTWVNKIRESKKGSTLLRRKKQIKGQSTAFSFRLGTTTFSHQHCQVRCTNKWL